MKKLIVHIGYPKTATTSLQHNFLCKLMIDGKIEYLNHLNCHEERLGEIYCRGIISYVTSGSKTHNINDELKKIKKIKAPTTVISSENISFFSKDFSWAYQNNKAIENAIRIKELFKDLFDSIEIIIGIRSQTTIIPSFYRQQYHHICGEQPKFNDFSKWLDSNFGNCVKNEDLIFNYNIMFEKYCQVFGENNVHVLLFEDMNFDKECFYNKLSEIFSVKECYVKKNLEKKYMNKGNANEQGLYLTEEPSFGHLITLPFRHLLRKNLNNESYDIIKNVYRFLVPKKIRDYKIGKAVGVRAMSENETSMILSKFSKGNIVLSKKLGLDHKKMSRYGYFL